MPQFNRRSFLKGSLLTATSAPALAASPAPALAASLAAAAQAAPATPENPIVDTHVYVSRWPARRVSIDQPDQLVSELRKQGVVQAWTGSFDAMLHKDIGAVNQRLAADCHRWGQGLLTPFGAVNPMLPDWEEDVRRCHEEFQMPGMRVHPNYHSYTLEHPEFLKLLQMTAERNLVLQIVAWLEDERTQIPQLQESMVDLRPLAALLEKTPKARVMVLNGFVSVRSVPLAWDRLKRLQNVTFDIAMLEQMIGVRVLADAIGIERVVFGSYSPMFYFESAFLKLREANLSAAETKAVLSGNAARWVSSRRA
jgi:predicted TIM-barrel fold metal-dependent hydrolase